MPAPALVDPSQAWSLLSPEPESRIDTTRWSTHAQRFFAFSLNVVPAKLYPNNATPICDNAQVNLRRASSGDSHTVEIVTAPVERAAAVMARARDAVTVIGGAGFDALLPRTRRVWQVRAMPETNPAAALALAAVLASVYLAPIVAPGKLDIFGVKGARERLARAGW